MSSRLSKAAFFPTSGLAPAPNPSVRFTPIWSFPGTALDLSAWESVLHTMNSTSLMPWLNMWLTALLPPPPIPITLMIDLWCFGKSNEYAFSVITIFIFSGCLTCFRSLTHDYALVIPLIFKIINEQTLGFIQDLRKEITSRLFSLRNVAFAVSGFVVAILTFIQCPEP